MPAAAHNRLGDNWRPLFAIAQHIGGHWPEKVLEAFNQLASKQKVRAQSLGLMLLADIRRTFEELGVQQLPSSQLVQALCNLTDRPWPDANKGGRPITEKWLAARLKDYKISSARITIENTRLQGYNLSDFEEVFKRFLNRDQE